MKKFNIKRKIALISSIGIIAATTTIACVASAITTSNNNENIEIKNANKNASFNINEVSKKWTNNTPSEHVITNDFDEILNYNKNTSAANISNKNHLSYINDVLLALNNTNKKSNKVISAFSTELNRLTTSQQNQVKNQMLKMYDITSKEKITYKNVETILSGFTTFDNIKKVKNLLLKYQTEPNNTTLNNKDKISYMLMHAQFNYSNNTQTTIGKLINSLNDATDVFAGISAAAALFAAGEYTAAIFDFGFSAPWAIASTAISAISGAFSAACGIAAMTIQSDANQLPGGWNTAITAFVSVYPLGSIIATLTKLSSTVITTVTFCSWAFAVGAAAVPIAIFILDIFNTIND